MPQLNLVSGRARELKAAHLQAHRAVSLLDAVYVGHIRENLCLGIRGRGTPAGRQRGLYIAGVRQVDRTCAIMLIESEQSASGPRRIEASNAKGRFALHAERDVKQQPPDRTTLLAAAQVVAPDQSDRHDTGAILHAGRRGHHRHPIRTEPQKSTCVRRREAFLQIRFSADFDGLPFWPFARQHELEAFAKGHARDLAPEFTAVGRGKIGDLKLTLRVAEAFGRETQPVAPLLFETGNFAHQVAPLIPGLQYESPIPFG